MSGTVVQKYGGSSMADADHIERVAARVLQTRSTGKAVVVVVSAMGHTTDELLALAKRIAPSPSRRELDMLLSAGERISMALLSLALNARGVDAISFTGSQSGIITNDAHTNARIVEVRPFRILDELDRGRVVIVAGYQGVSYKREITTLGRGGSDTTAVALAAALDAEACEIYSDVPGVFSADPRVVSGARPLAELSYEEMQELAESGARVLNAQAVEFAKAKDIVIYARATASDGETSIRKFPADAPTRVAGIAAQLGVCVVTLPGRATERWSAALAELDVPVREIGFGAGAQPYVLISLEDVHDLSDLQDRLSSACGAAVRVDQGLGTVTVVGAGIGSDSAAVREVVSVLHQAGIETCGLSASGYRIRVLVAQDDAEQAQGLLHQALVECSRGTTG